MTDPDLLKPRLFMVGDMWIAIPPGPVDLDFDLYGDGLTQEAAVTQLLLYEDWKHLKFDEFIVGSLCRACKSWVTGGAVECAKYRSNDGQTLKDPLGDVPTAS